MYLGLYYHDLVLNLVLNYMFYVQLYNISIEHHVKL